MRIAGENEALLSSILWGKYKYRIIEHEIKSAKTSIFKKQRKMCCQKRGILWEFSEWGEGVSAIPIAMLDNNWEKWPKLLVFHIGGRSPPKWENSHCTVFLDSVPKTGWMLFLAEIKIWEDDSLTLKSVLITWYGFPPNFIQPLLKLL